MLFRSADKIAEPAASQEELERFILEEIESGRPLRGVYPPDRATLTRYHESRLS